MYTKISEKKNIWKNLKITQYMYITNDFTVKSSNLEGNAGNNWKVPIKCYVFLLNITLFLIKVTRIFFSIYKNLIYNPWPMICYKIKILHYNFLLRIYNSRPYCCFGYPDTWPIDIICNHFALCSQTFTLVSSKFYENMCGNQIKTDVQR